MLSIGPDFTALERAVLAAICDMNSGIERRLKRNYRLRPFSAAKTPVLVLRRFVVDRALSTAIEICVQGTAKKLRSTD